MANESFQEFSKLILNFIHDNPLMATVFGSYAIIAYALYVIRNK